MRGYDSGSAYFDRRISREGRQVDFNLCLCEHAGFRAFFVIPDTHSLAGLYLGHTILSTFPLKYSTSCTGYVLWLLLQ